jgi:hypothetical protein
MKYFDTKIPADIRLVGPKIVAGDGDEDRDGKVSILPCQRRHYFSARNSHTRSNFELLYEFNSVKCGCLYGSIPVKKSRGRNQMKF